MNSQNVEKQGTTVPPLNVPLTGTMDDTVSNVTARSMSLTTTSGVKSSDTGSSGRENGGDGQASSSAPIAPVERVLVPTAVQNEEHYKQLLEQGKLRHGSIIKTTNRRSKGSQGSHVVLGIDGTPRRMPKSGSQSSLLMASESSVDMSQPSQSGIHESSRQSDTGSTMEDSRKPRGYTIRERESLDELWIFIVNGLKKKVWEKKCGRLLNQLSLVKWKVYITKYPGHARKLAYRAQNKGADMIIAVGGDGTLQEVVDGMMRSHCKDEMGLPKAVLTVLPAGSSNDFHQSMEWSTDFEDALWRIGKQGETALVDVGKVTCVGPGGGPVSRYWINISSFGVSGRISGKIESYKYWGMLKYKIAGFFESLKYILCKSSPVLVSYDGGEWEFIRNVTLMAACNGHTFGDGLRISEGASPFTGDLDMVLVKCGRSLIKVASVIQQMARGTPSQSKRLTSRKCHTVDIIPADSRGNALQESLIYKSQTEESNGFYREDSTVSLDKEDSTVSQQEEIQHDDTGTEVTSKANDQDLSYSVPGRGNVHDLKSIHNDHKENVKRLVAHRLPVECDGECIGHLPASYQIIPGAIKFRIPKSRDPY